MYTETSEINGVHVNLHRDNSILHVQIVQRPMDGDKEVREWQPSNPVPLYTLIWFYIFFLNECVTHDHKIMERRLPIRSDLL
jgi:hypothetical protein